MEEKRIKSAWEIAMEKIEKMGELTAEEKREMKEKEFAPKGEIIAGRFLDGSRYLEIELQRLKNEEEREIVKRAALETFKKAIKIEDFSRSQRGLEGMKILGKDVANLKNKMALLIEEYKREIEKAVREKEGQLKISGSALSEINLEATEIWPEINLEFNAKLNQLSSSLIASEDEDEALDSST